jgi:hypothetical protein
MTMDDVKQDFETFLREWAKERIWPTENFLDNRDRRYMAERRAVELTKLALEKGFGDELGAAMKRYGNTVQYVTHLMWEADFYATRPRGLK